MRPRGDPQAVIEEIEDAEFGNRHPRGHTRKVLAALAGGWSLFQLATAELILLDSLLIRCIHLAFALALVLLSFTATKGRGAPVRRVLWWEWALAGIGALAAVYLALFHDAISGRQGLPTVLDLVAGAVLVISLLEAARRCLGPALPVTASIFILSSLFASSLPGFLASKDVSLPHLLSKLTLSTEGVYGVPLRISADTIFLFVLFGAMLEKSGGGEFFVRLAFSLLGRFQGGPAKAAVLASGLTGMVSGSSIANTVTTGTFTIPLMKRCGYPATKAGAIEVAASTNGQLMPPIMGAAAFIIAEYCNIQYLEVVRAAIIPALLSYLALIYITHIEARKLGMERVPKSELPNFFKVLTGGLHFLLPLGLLIYLLVFMRQSAAKSAYYATLALAGIESLRVILQALRRGESVAEALRDTLQLIWDSLVAGARNMMSIGVAVAAAGIIVGVVSLGLGGKVTDIIDTLSGGYLIPVLLITALVSLVLGMGLPTTANYIVMANITAPTIVLLSAQAGMPIPLIAAHLFCFYFGILADDTPPVGLAAYAASAIAKSAPIRTAIQGFIYDLRTAILPFMFVFNLQLLLIGVEGWAHIAWVFTTGLVAMFAFASLTQQYLFMKITAVESGLLIAAIALLMQPTIVANTIGVFTPWVWALIGLGCFGIVLSRQWSRQKKPVSSLIVS